MTLARVAAHQSATGFRASPLEELLDAFPTTTHYRRTKPTTRFLRKFGRHAHRRILQPRFPLRVYS